MHSSKDNPLFSVVIPALNEEKYIGRCLKSIKSQTFKNFEIIVCDGNSKDKTIEIAKKYADKVITSEMGIGLQQNNAAKIAKGEFLLFTQADTVLMHNVLEKIFNLLKKDNEIVFGNIHNHVEELDWKGKLLNKFYFISNNLSFLKLTNGTGFFVRKDIFQKVGGFRNIINEDWEIGLRLKKHGKYGAVSNTYTVTSTRRFRKEGYLKTIVCWLKQYFLFLIGKSTPVENYSLIR